MIGVVVFIKFDWFIDLLIGNFVVIVEYLIVIFYF